jgi:hypothetical protein
MSPANDDEGVRLRKEIAAIEAALTSINAHLLATQMRLHVEGQTITFGKSVVTGSLPRIEKARQDLENHHGDGIKAARQEASQGKVLILSLKTQLTDFERRLRAEAESLKRLVGSVERIMTDLDKGPQSSEDCK